MIFVTVFEFGWMDNLAHIVVCFSCVLTGTNERRDEWRKKDLIINFICHTEGK